MFPFVAEFGSKIVGEVIYSVIYPTEPNINEWSNWLKSVPQHTFWEWTEWRYGGEALERRNLIDMVDSSWWGVHSLDWFCLGDALFGHVPALPDSSHKIHFEEK